MKRMRNYMLIDVTSLQPTRMETAWNEGPTVELEVATVRTKVVGRGEEEDVEEIGLTVVLVRAGGPSLESDGDGTTRTTLCWTARTSRL